MITAALLSIVSLAQAIPVNPKPLCNPGPCAFQIAPVLVNGTTACVSCTPVMDCSPVTFMMGLPSGPADGLLVLCHGLYNDELFEGGGGGGNPAVAAARDELMDAAMGSGLYVLSVAASCIGCSGIQNGCPTYSGVDFHEHLEFAIEYMLAQYPTIQRTKVYGFGWSMGGGDILSYAARHLDPAGPGASFAAVWARSPTGSMPVAWDLATNGFKSLYEDLLDGPGGPDVSPFAFARASTIWTRTSGSMGVADLDLSLAHNLVGTPVWISRAPANDIEAGIWAWEAYQAYFGGDFTVFLTTQSDHHDWSDLDGVALVQQLLQAPPPPPTTGRLLAVEDRKYREFHVDRELDDQLGDWTWTIDHVSTPNRVSLLQAANLAVVRMDVLELGLDEQAGFEIDFDPSTGPADADVVLTGLTGVPRVGWLTGGGIGGVLLPGPTTWQWNTPNPGELTLHEPFGPAWYVRVP